MPRNSEYFLTSERLGFRTWSEGDLDLAVELWGDYPHNERSRNLLLKLGFAYTHDEFYEPTGLEHPSYLLTADEYADLTTNMRI